MFSETHERAEPAEFVRIAPDVRRGKGVVLNAFINLYGCQIGDETRIGTFVEIQKNMQVGARCKIQSHIFICDAGRFFLPMGVAPASGGGEFWPPPSVVRGGVEPRRGGAPGL